jgi:hypothetical protein
VDNNYLDLGMNKSGFIHTLPSGRLNALHRRPLKVGSDYRDQVSTSCRPVPFNSSRTEINPNLHNIYHYFLNISIISNRKRTSGHMRHDTAASQQDALASVRAN